MQLNLFAGLPVPESDIWEKLDDQDKQLITAAITRILVKAAMRGNSSIVAQPNDSQPGSNYHE